MVAVVVVVVVKTVKQRGSFVGYSLQYGQGNLTTHTKQKLRQRVLYISKTKQFSSKKPLMLCTRALPPFCMCLYMFHRMPTSLLRP